MSRPRRAAYIWGLRAESLAALWLRLKFYKILARNFTAAGAEIDLIARRGLVLALVEVKARPDAAAALSAIDPRKAQRISRAARAWLATHPAHSGCALRGDAMLIVPRHLPRHVEAAFEIDVWL